ncbi:hypothetical protein [Streptomyces decoyicus]
MNGEELAALAALSLSQGQHRVLGWARRGQLEEFDDGSFWAMDINPSRPDVNKKIAKGRVVGMWRAGWLKTRPTWHEGVVVGRDISLTAEGERVCRLLFRAEKAAYTTGAKVWQHAPKDVAFPALDGRSRWPALGDGPGEQQAPPPPPPPAPREPSIAERCGIQPEAGETWIGRCGWRSAEYRDFEVWIRRARYLVRIPNARGARVEALHVPDPSRPHDVITLGAVESLADVMGPIRQHATQPAPDIASDPSGMDVWEGEGGAVLHVVVPTPAAPEWQPEQHPEPAVLPVTDAAIRAAVVTESLPCCTTETERALFARVARGDGSAVVVVSVRSDTGTGWMKTAVIRGGIDVDGSFIPAEQGTALYTSRATRGMNGAEWVKRQMWRSDPARSRLVSFVPVRFECDAYGTDPYGRKRGPLSVDAHPAPAGAQHQGRAETSAPTADAITDPSGCEVWEDEGGTVPGVDVPTTAGAPDQEFSAVALRIAQQAADMAKRAADHAMNKAMRITGNAAASVEEAMHTAHTHATEAARHAQHAQQEAEAQARGAVLANHARAAAALAGHARTAAGLIPAPADDLAQRLARPLTAAQQAQAEREQAERDDLFRRAMEAETGMSAEHQRRLSADGDRARDIVPRLHMTGGHVSVLRLAVQGRLWLDEAGAPHQMVRLGSELRPGRRVSSERVEMLRAAAYLVRGTNTDRGAPLHLTPTGRELLYLATLYPEGLHPDDRTAQEARYIEAKRPGAPKEEAKAAARHLPRLDGWKLRHGMRDADTKPARLTTVPEVGEDLAHLVRTDSDDARLAGRFARWQQTVNDTVTACAVAVGAVPQSGGEGGQDALLPSADASAADAARRSRCSVVRDAAAASKRQESAASAEVTDRAPEEGQTTRSTTDHSPVAPADVPGGPRDEEPQRQVQGVGHERRRRAAAAPAAESPRLALEVAPIWKELETAPVLPIAAQSGTEATWLDVRPPLAAVQLPEPDSAAPFASLEAQLFELSAQWDRVTAPA